MDKQKSKAGKILIWILIICSTGLITYVFAYRHIHQHEIYFKNFAIEANRELPQELGSLCVLDSIKYNDHTLLYHGHFQQDYQLDSESTKQFYSENMNEIRFDMMSFLLTALRDKENEIIDMMEKGGISISNVIHFPDNSTIDITFDSSDLSNHRELMNAQNESDAGVLANILCNQLTRADYYGVLNGGTLSLDCEAFTVDSIDVIEGDMVRIQFLTDFELINNKYPDYRPAVVLQYLIESNPNAKMVKNLGKTLRTPIDYVFRDVKSRQTICMILILPNN